MIKIKYIRIKTEQNNQYTQFHLCNNIKFDNRNSMLKCKLYKFLEYYLHELVLKVHFFALFLKLFVGYLPDVNIIKALLSKEEDWLLELVLESLGFNLFKGFTVDIQKTLATLAVGNSSGSLLATKGLNRLDGFLSVSHLNKICVKVKASNNLN